MDCVYIRQLKVDTIIGIHDWERRVRQSVYIDLEMAVDMTQAAATENIDEALDYQAVAQRATDFIQAGEFQLLETLAQRLADDLQAIYSLGWMSMRVSKPAALTQAADVGVLVERGQRPV